MPHISAIELENFQSIGRRTRIELKPITLLYGPNSAGKSAVFDALQLLQVLLDPVYVDEEKATEMVDRWARRCSKDIRETTLAIEFPFEFIDQTEIWDDRNNWKTIHKTRQWPHFTDHDEDYLEGVERPLNGRTVRIELILGIHEYENISRCLLLKGTWSIGEYPVLSIDGGRPTGEFLVRKYDRDSGEYSHEVDKEQFIESHHQRWLEIYEETGLIDQGTINGIDKYKNDPLYQGEFPILIEKNKLKRLNCRVETSASPIKISVEEERSLGWRFGLSICENARDIIIYLSTMLWGPLRKGAGPVQADRRSPRPEEVLTIVDNGLRGWWSRAKMSPSSPAALLKSRSTPIDEHFQGLAESAHASLLLRTSNTDSWGSDDASKYIEKVRPKAALLDRINHHLEGSLFTEKLYRLECASTLMVPIDLNEEDPWSYYALAQPAAVRLYLREPDGNTVELNDVGSGVSYVLPVLYALCRQGLVQIQQPELHLHPALQSSIADVLIEEMHQRGFGQVLIETHSEHLLLRLLRRIRDTEKQNSLSNEHKITNRDLGVYYFDPQPGKETHVSQQLLTPLGDFYNDWPRGFFAERNMDLFDEE